MKLKQAALNFARKRWADYVMVNTSVGSPSALQLYPKITSELDHKITDLGLVVGLHLINLIS